MYKGASTSTYCSWEFDETQPYTGFCIPDEGLKSDSDSNVQAELALCSSYTTPSTCQSSKSTTGA